MGKVLAGHSCPHERRDRTGMEVCVVCDFAICGNCGDEFNQRDMQGGRLCYPCARIRKLEGDLRAERLDLAHRRRRNGLDQVAPKRAETTSPSA